MLPALASSGRPLVCVDTFAGSAEHVAAKELPEDGLEAVFDVNVALIDASRVRKLVGDSKHVLADCTTKVLVSISSMWADRTSP